MKIALIGSSGEIGQLIQKRVLLKNKYNYVRFGRTEDRLGSLNGIAFCEYDFIEDDLILDEEFDYVIHCAYDFKDLRISEENVNYKAIQKINFNRNCKIIYISSVLAENSFSNYGRVKKKIENLVCENGGFSLRIGIVESKIPISNIKLLTDLATRMRILILPGLDSQVLISNDEKVAETLIDIIENKVKLKETPIIFAVSYISTLRTCIRKIISHKIILINLPLNLLNPMFYFSKRIKFIRPISDKFENLKLAPQQYSSWGRSNNSEHQ